MKLSIDRFSSEVNKHLFLPLLMCVLFLGSQSVLLGQDNRMTEEEIRLEEMFITALAQKKDGEADKAIETLEGILASDRRNHAALYEIARIQKRQEKEMDALQSIERAIRIEPSNIWYHIFKAGLQEIMGNYEGAAITYKDIIELEPYNSKHYFRQADNYLRMNKISPALQSLELAQQKIGSFEELHQRRYDIYRSTGDLDKASGEIAALLFLFPSNTEYLYMQANYFAQFGKQQKADSLFQLILEVDPDDARVQLALAGRQKESDDAAYIRSLFPLMKNPEAALDPKIIELIPYVEKLALEEDVELVMALIEAVSHLEAAHKNEGKILALKGDIYQLSGDVSLAIGAYRQSLRFEKGVFTVWQQLMYLLLEEGDFDVLYEVAEDALDVFPNQLSIWIFHAKSLWGMKRHNDALISLDQALLMVFDQNNIKQELLSLRAMILYDMGDKKEGGKSFEEALSVNPQHPLHVSRKAFFQATADADMKGAITLLENNLKKNPEQPVLLGTLACVYYLDGQREKAGKLLDMVSDLSVVLLKMRSLVADQIETSELSKIWRMQLEGATSQNL